MHRFQGVVQKNCVFESFWSKKRFPTKNVHLFGGEFRLYFLVAA